MELTLTKVNKFGSTVYKIENQNSTPLYMCKKRNLLFGVKYTMFDKKGQLVGEVKKTFKNDCPYIFISKGKIIEEVKLLKKLPIEKYQLKNKKWNIESDLTYMEYIVFDEKNKQLLQAKLDLLNENYTWKINVDNDKELLIYIMLILTIVSIAKK